MGQIAVEAYLQNLDVRDMGATVAEMLTRVLKPEDVRDE